MACAFVGCDDEVWFWSVSEALADGSDCSKMFYDGEDF